MPKGNIYSDWRSVNWAGKFGQPAGVRRPMITKASASLSKSWADFLMAGKPRITGIPIPGKPPPPGIPVPGKPPLPGRR